MTTADEPAGGGGPPRPQWDPASAALSVSARFSRVMNATTSRYGVLTDPPLVALATAVLVILWLATSRLDGEEALAGGLRVLMALPLAVAVVTSLALLGARGRLIAWLSGLPFPVENLNAALNGLGDALEITFAQSYPEAPVLNAELDKVHGDTFVTRTEPETRVIEVRIGVVDSKRNPARSNHERFARVQRLVTEVLVPLAQKHPIVEVRIK